MALSEFDLIAKWQPDRIHCKEQGECPFYYPWKGPHRTTEFERGYIRCEHLGDDHRCGHCSIGEECGEHDWVCTQAWNLEEDGRRKKVEVVLKEEG